MVLKLKKNVVVALCFVVLFMFMFLTTTKQANAAGTLQGVGLTVYNVTADSLSIRTGPGTSYAKIATIYNGTDVIETCRVHSEGDCSTNSGPGGVYSFLKVYYPVSSIGKYSSSAIGWVMDQDGSSGYLIFYLDSTYGADVASSTGMPQHYYTSCPDLGSPALATFSNGTYLPRYLNNNAILAEECNPNAWGMNTPTSTATPSHSIGNGWKLNAKS